MDPPEEEPRVCQFYLRGRCQKENCDFKHDPEMLKVAKEEAKAKEKEQKNEKICTFYQVRKSLLGSLTSWTKAVRLAPAAKILDFQRWVQASPIKLPSMAGKCL